MCQRGDGFAVTVVFTRHPGYWNGFAAEGKSHVESRWSRSANYISADSEPIRFQVRVTDPGLQVSHKRHPRRPRRRQIQEIASAAYLHLRAKEIVVQR